MKTHLMFSLLSVASLLTACASEPRPAARSASPPPPAPAAAGPAWGSPGDAPDDSPEAIGVIVISPSGQADASSGATEQAAPPDVPAPGTVAERRQRKVAVRTAIVDRVAEHHKEMRRCYDRAARTNGSLEGRVTVRLVVAPSGEVVEVANDGSTLGDESVVKCVMGVFSAIKFEPFAGKAATIIYPVEFSQPR